MSTREKRVEHYRRQGGEQSGQWLLTVCVASSGRVVFPALGGDVSFDDVYEKTEAFGIAS